MDIPGSDSALFRPLPIPAPVHARPGRHRQPDDRLNLPPVVHPAMILAPCRLLGIADQIGARDMVMVADLRPAEAGEELLGPIRINAPRIAVELLVIDPLHGEAGLQVIPAARLIRHDLGSLGDAGGDEAKGGGL